MPPADPIDQPLRELLHRWKPCSTPSPRFASHVWSRLENPQPVRNFSFFAALRPAAIIALISLGAAGGYAAAQQKAAAVEKENQQQAVAEYVRTIDPLLMANSHSAR
jgi:hypothetical protein